MVSHLDNLVSIEDYEKRNDRFCLAVCILGSFFLCLFAVKSFFSGLYAYALTLTLFAVGASLLALYFWRSNNRRVLHLTIATGFTVINLFLLYTGGEDNTGIFWFYTYPLIVFTLLGARIGLILSVSVYAVSVFLLFYPELSHLLATYSLNTKLRFTGSMLFVIALGYLMEVSRVQAQRSSHRANAMLKMMATRDELTGLYNRRAIRDIFEQRIEKQTTLAICDVDFFKKINDRYGHEIGDKVLKKVAISLQHSLRETDVVVRWGGEEFLVLLPNTDLKEGINIIERMRYELSASSFEIAGHALNLSISAGIVSADEHESWDDMITMADKYLYQAKESGRNCSFADIDEQLLEIA
ncbi:GGDEF domain-containing protein [Litoribrevibacter albus]|uniref:GGDEF domain-containing protein n=1 Tax=Litoribrevibacter albus TaxID=1473156 RepID=UPI0024E0F76B|nr:GGDEF domain-containing protein [Litoribrevibacter albus]